MVFEVETTDRLRYGATRAADNFEFELIEPTRHSITLAGVGRKARPGDRHARTENVREVGPRVNSECADNSPAVRMVVSRNGTKHLRIGGSLQMTYAFDLTRKSRQATLHDRL